MKIVLCFPNSLFEDNKLINNNACVYIIEHPVYYTLYPYHKLKLILHRASMKYYAVFIKKKYRCQVKYEYDTNLQKLFRSIREHDIHFYDPVDHLVMRNMKRLAKQFNKRLVVTNTPLFLSKLEDLAEYKKSKSYSHNSFYKWQRQRFNILMKNNKPVGGKWSFDVDNRKPFPNSMINNKKNYKPRAYTNKYIDKAKRYVDRHFNNNIGNTDIYFSIDHKGAKKHLRKFIKERLKCFGPYQDAVHSNIPFGCHSIISPLLNIGLLTPKYVLHKLEQDGAKYRVPLSSLEGIIRQILGWREYVRMLYMFERRQFESNNHFNHKRRL